MSSIFRFHDFPVYRKVLQFRTTVKEYSRKHFPNQEDFVLRPQLWRALDSIALNIAEGSDRYSDKDFSKFLNQALASLYEVVACLDCALSDGYMQKEEYSLFIRDAENICKQLKAFSAHVRINRKAD